MKNRERCLIQTVKENEIGYAKRELDQAKLARKIYGMVGHPSIKDYKWMAQEGALLNCPVTHKDIDVAEKVYGKDIAALKGKTVRTKPLVVKTNIIEVPRNILKLHKDVVLEADLYYVNGLCFIGSISHKILLNISNHGSTCY